MRADIIYSTVIIIIEVPMGNCMVYDEDINLLNNLYEFEHFTLCNSGKFTISSNSQSYSNDATEIFCM